MYVYHLVKNAFKDIITLTLTFSISQLQTCALGNCQPAVSFIESVSMLTVRCDTTHQCKTQRKKRRKHCKLTNISRHVACVSRCGRTPPLRSSTLWGPASAACCACPALTSSRTTASETRCLWPSSTAARACSRVSPSSRCSASWLIRQTRL